jgi:hypothetical protein
MYIFLSLGQRKKERRCAYCDTYFLLDQYSTTELLPIGYLLRLSCLLDPFNGFDQIWDL